MSIDARTDGNRSAPGHCPLCGGPGPDRLVVPAPAGSDSPRVVRCPNCGILKADPFPTPAQIAARYQKEYFCSPAPLKGGYEDYRADESNIRKTFERRLARFFPNLPKNGRVLDIGCASGVFLEVMRDRGWETFGVEISGYAAGLAQAKGLQVVCVPLSSDAFGGQSFDLITLWDVIEHVEDPVAFLAACARRLRPDGRLALTTPDASALLARCLGRYWLGFRSVGEHLYFFGRDTLRFLMDRAGLEIIEMTSVGKVMTVERLITRLSYYTRLFRVLWPFRRWFSSQIGLYVNSGDTVCVVARPRH